MSSIVHENGKLFNGLASRARCFTGVKISPAENTPVRALVRELRVDRSVGTGIPLAGFQMALGIASAR